MAANRTWQLVADGLTDVELELVDVHRVAWIMQQRWGLDAYGETEPPVDLLRRGEDVGRGAQAGSAATPKLPCREPGIG